MRQLYFMMILLVAFIGTAGANTFTVTNTYDAGAGSLRQAIIDANSHPGADTILFNIQGPGAGPYIIQPATDLPVITGPLLINGYSEPNSYPATSDYPAKIMIVIDGNNARTVCFQLGDPSNPGLADNTVIRGLSVINFAYRAILCYSGSVSVEGNLFGIRPDGTAAGANNIGILLAGADNCTIGGATRAAGNVISNSRSYGIQIQPAAGNSCTGNTIRNNIIGLDAKGLNAGGNGGHGILVSALAAAAGSISILDNQIACNSGSGISLDGGGSTNISNIIIKRNRIGINTAGQSRPNLGNGILINNATMVNVGGAIPDQNTIAFNGGAGVVVAGSGSSGNSISGNSIYQNSALGIDLGQDGVSSNDPGDGDSGPNALQNFPVIDSAVLDGNQLKVYGKVSFVNGFPHILEFFCNPEYLVPDPSGYGEGYTSIGTMNITGAGVDWVPFVFTATNACAYHDFITAAATNPITQNSSEFSAYKQVTSVKNDVCADTGPGAMTFSVPPVPDATSYNWTIPSGAAMISGQGTTTVVIDWMGMSAGTYEVCSRAVNSCGTSNASCLPVSVINCITLAGHVYHDGNGLAGSPANTVDGPGVNPGGTLFASLVNPLTNTVIASVPVQPGGSYHFSSGLGLVINTAYRVILTSSSATPGSPLSLSALPPGWVSTGEFNGTGPGNDGTPDGIIQITVGNVSLAEVNFGIEQLPETNEVSSSLPTPGGDNSSVCPSLNGQDPEDCPVSGTCSAGRTYIIESVPLNASLFYDFDGTGSIGPVLLTNNTLIMNYDPEQLMVDPAFSGSGTVVFYYSLVDSAGQADPTAAACTITFNPVADLAVTKVDTPDPVFPGAALTYAITLMNHGVSDARGITVTEILPSVLSVQSVSASAGNWSPPVWSIDSLENGATATLTIMTNVAITLGYQVITNTVTAASITPDPDITNNTATTTTVINPSANLSVTKYGAPDPVNAGDQVIYTIKVFNTGPDGAENVVITDILPTGLHSAGYSLNGGVSWQPWINILSVGSIPGGDSIRLLISATLNPDISAGTKIVNSVHVSASTFDPDPAGNMATDTVTASNSADLVMFKEALTAPVTIGDTILYKLTVNNLGPGNAANITVADPLDQAIFAETAFSDDNGITWFSPWTGSYNIPLLVHNTHVHLYLRGRVLDANPLPNVDPIPNTASVVSPVSDPVAANNVVTIYTPLNQTADISVVKSGPVSVLAGDTIYYQLEVTNHSSTYTASGVMIMDDIDNMVIPYPEYSLNGGLSWFPWTGSVNAGELNPLDSLEVLIRGLVKSNITQGIPNTAEVTSNIPDPNTLNNESSILTPVEVVADLNIEKRADSLMPPAGGTVNYIITVVNSGPGDATGISVYDLLPGGLQYTGHSTLTGSYNPATGLWQVENLAAYSNAILNIAATVGVTGPYTNIAAVSSGVTDPDPENNADTATVRVIRANTDNATANPVNGMTGGTAVNNVLGNDLLNGLAINQIDVTISAIEDPPDGVTLNSATGAVTVAPGTPAGTYNITYRICETLYPAHCDQASVFVAVFSPTGTIVANDDAGCAVSDAGGTAVSNVLSNDLLNGNPILPGNVGITQLSTTNPGITLDGVSVVVAAGVPGGIYQLIYRICDPLHPANCDNATVTVTVIEASTSSSLLLCSQYSTVLTGNWPLAGCTGNWTFLSGPTVASVGPPNSPMATATGLAGSAVPYIFRYTMTTTVNGITCSAYADLTVLNHHYPSPAYAGENQQRCLSTGTTTSTVLSAAFPVYGQGHWSQLNGPTTAGIAEPDNPVTNADNLTTGSYTFLWQVGNGICDSTYDVMVVNVITPATAFAGTNAKICESSVYALNSSTASNYLGLVWTTSGTGTFNNINSLHPVYTPGAADITSGNVILTLTALSNPPCGNAVSAMLLTIYRKPQPNAGQDAVVCSQAGAYTLSGASVAFSNSYSWTENGAGAITAGANALNPTYTFGPGESGSVKLTLVANPVFGSPCSASQDSVFITIVPPAAASAGSNDTICSSQAGYALEEATAANFSSLFWSTSGTGIFNNISEQNPVYIPGAADISAGQVTLTLTAVANQPCSNAVSSMVLTLEKAPIASAGQDATICETSAYYICNATAANYTTFHWETPGTGTFSNINILDPVYLPGQADIEAGCVWLILKAEGNAPCTEVADSMKLCISRIPLADAGPDAEMCTGSSFQVTQVSAQFAANITWSSSGTGTFSNPHLLNPVYFPGTSDTAAGSVVLTMTLTALSPCPNASDEMSLTFSPGLNTTISVVSYPGGPPSTNGALQVSVSNGIPPYNYLWSNGDTTSVISGLAAGFYTVTVTDIDGCSGTASAELPQTPCGLWVVGDVIDVTCHGLNNGAVLVNGGSNPAPYTFLWSNGTTNQHLVNVGKGYYTITVTDLYGCTVSDTWFVDEPDSLVLQGTSTNVNCQSGAGGSVIPTISGGVPPYLFYWSNGAVTANQTNLQPGTYTLEVTDDNYCTVSKTWVILPCTDTCISGFVQYRNIFSTPLNGVSVFLSDSLGALVTVTTTGNEPGTGAPGYFAFNGLSPGTYHLSGTYNGIWGGNNATDALLIELRIVGSHYFIPLQDTVGNVNASGFPYLSGMDALYVKMRTVGQISGYPAGDWKVNDTSVNFSGAALQANLRALCYGDVNGSYIPGGVKETTVFAVDDREIMEIGPDKPFKYEIKASAPFNLGAITLYMRYDPSRFEIQKVTSDLGNFKYNIEAGKVSLAWSDTRVADFRRSQPVFSFLIRARERVADPEGIFTLIPGSEFADAYAIPFGQVEISMAKVVTAGHIRSLNVQCYPNPFSQISNISYSLPDAGYVRISLTNLFGQEIVLLAGDEKNAGLHTIIVDPVALNIPAGVYFYRLTFQSAGGVEVRCGKQVYYK